jgi:hypothetical protein
MASTRRPWVDVHAHPGRCFLAGLNRGDPLAGMLGGADIGAALSAAWDAGLAAVTLSTVADLRVLAPDAARGLRAVRDLGPGESYADHRRHLDHADRHHPRLLSPAHARAVAEAGGVIGAWPSGVTSTGLADFADEIARLADLVGTGHVAIGTDMDANYHPVLTSYAEFAALPGMLATRGFSEDDSDRVLGGNALDLLRVVTAQP